MRRWLFLGENAVWNYFGTILELIYRELCFLFALFCLGCLFRNKVIQLVLRKPNCTTQFDVLYFVSTYQVI